MTPDHQLHMPHFMSKLACTGDAYRLRIILRSAFIYAIGVKVP